MRGSFSGMKLAIWAALFAWPVSGALAQTSLGGVDPSTPSQPPPFVVPAPAPALPRPSSPRMDYIPTLPDSSNRTPAQTPNPAAGELWAAIGFTADGSYASAWKADSKSEAEAEVAKKCARFGRGGCEISAVSGRECLALAASQAGRWKLSFTARGSTFPEAQTNAVNYCNADPRSRNRCQFRTAVCADGR
jgi:hypothetical protein